MSDVKVIRYLLSKENSQKGQLLAALAVFNREETMCGVVLLQLHSMFLLCAFLCSLHFPPLFSLLQQWGHAQLFHHQKTRQNHFFHTGYFSVEKKGKEKG